mgnify:CR=1 FL=1
MAVIKPPITGDLVLDSWLNQITQALNTGVVGTSAGGTSQVKSGASGFNTATIYLYARTSTDSAPSAMNEETTYTYETGVLVNGASHDGVSNGLGPNDVWFRNVPSGAGGYLWVTTVHVADTAATESIASGSWSAVTKLAEKGEQGKFAVELYKRSSSAPSAPTDITWTYATSAITGNNSASWALAVPSGTDQVWISSAIFDPSTAATNITSWGTPFQGGTTGPAGAAGTNNATVAIYQKNTSASSAPSNPSGTFTYTFSTGVLSAGTFNSWTQTIPTLAKGEYLWMKHATASSTTATDSIPASEFSAAAVTGAAGIDGNSVAVVELYQVSTSNSSAPADPSGTFTYTFATDALSGGTSLNGWSQAVPNVPTGQYLWTIQASAVSDTTTDTIAASEFSAAVVVSGVGSPGADGDDGDPGATGPTGPRQTTGVIYYTAQSANAPTRPTNGTSGGTSNATWNWSAGNFSTLPNNWSLTPPTPNPTDTNAYWQSAFSSYEATNGGTTNLTFEAPTKIILFDGIVKFTNSNNSIASTSGGSTTTVFFPKVFRQSGIPTSLAKNDVWIDTDDNQMYIAQIAGADAVTTGEWERSVDATAQSAANTATTNAATAQTTANTAVTNAATAQSTANTAASNATAAQGELNDISDDDKLTPVEKLQVKTIWDAIRGEYSGIIAAATDAGIATNHSKYTDYTSAYSALTTYLVSGTGSISIFDTNGDLVLSSGEIITTSITRSTFDSRFETYYNTRQALLDFISATLKDRADLAVTNAATAQTAATTAQSAADSKTKTFRQDGEPSSGMSEGDLWFDTDAENQLYLFDGTDWIREDFAALIDAHTTTINGGKITTGTISSNKIDANKIDAAKLSLNSELTIQNNAGIKSGKDSAADTSIGVFLGTDNSGEFALVTASGSGDSASAVTISAAQTILKNPIIQTGTSVSDTAVTRTTTSTDTITADPSHEDSGGTNPFQKLTVSAVGGGGSGARGNSGGNGNTGGTTLVTIARTVTGSTSTARAAAVTAMAAIQNATLSLSGSGGAGGVGSSGSYSAGAATGSATLGLGAGGAGGVGNSSGMADYFGGAGGAAGNVDTAIIDIKNLKEVAWEAAGNSDSSVTAPTSGDPSGTNLPSIVFTISTTQIGAAGAQLTGGTSPGGAASTGGMGYVTDSGVLSQLNLDSLAGVSAQDSTISLSGDSNSGGTPDFTVNQSTAETITIAGGTGITTVGDGTEGSSSITINLDSTIASNTTGNAATATTSTFVSGTVGLGNGGTGATSAAAARANLGSPVLIESDSGNADPVASDFTSGIYFVVQY